MDIISQNEQFLQAISTAELYAVYDGPVMITGETGTGKELFANLIHDKSRRRNSIFLSQNCAAFSGAVLESELFGHEKGSFTGATRTHLGKFERAANGTLFLDEIGEMPLEQQSKFLRVLESGEYERVGGEEIIHSKPRIISATNRDLWEMVMEGKFRSDLYYRLNVLKLSIPPLRNRTGDIPLLCEYFLKKISIDEKLPEKTISKEAVQYIQGYFIAKDIQSGNIRELKNIVYRLFVQCHKNEIDQRLTATVLDVYSIDQNNFSFKETMPYTQFREQTEYQYFKTQFEIHNKNVALMAKRLEIDISNLRKKLKELGIE